MEPKDTAPAETVSAPTPESAANPQATDSANVEPAKEQAPQVQEESPEELRKRLQQLEMERNLLKNKTEKFEREQEDKRKAEMTELERLQEELSEYKNKEAYSEAEKLRNSIVQDYLKDDPEALKAAQALIDKGLVNVGWGDVATEDEARTAVQGQLDALRDVLKTSTAPAAEGNSNVNPNNPAPLGEPQLDHTEELKKAGESRDFSKLIQRLPSVQTQIKRMKGEA